MMCFSEYLEAIQAALPSPLWLTQATAATIASPDKEDTKRAIERAAKRGKAVTPDDLRACISPESIERAQRAVTTVPTDPGVRGTTPGRRAAGLP